MLLNTCVLRLTPHPIADRITDHSNGVSRYSQPFSPSRGASSAALDHIKPARDSHGSRVANYGQMGERRLSCQRYYTTTRVSTYTDVHPSVVKSQWNSALRMTDQLPGARGSYSSWSSTWQLFSRFLPDVREWALSSPA